MRRKAIIVLAVTFMVTVMVTAFSYLYISQILRQRITNAYEGASRLTQQLAYFAENDLPDLSSTRIDASLENQKSCAKALRFARLPRRAATIAQLSWPTVLLK